jgi:hypothetical protein
LRHPQGRDHAASLGTDGFVNAERPYSRLHPFPIAKPLSYSQPLPAHFRT